MTMTHPGLPFAWGMAILALMLPVLLWALFSPLPAKSPDRSFNLIGLPFIGKALQKITTAPGLLFSLKFFTVTLFLTVIVAGLAGTPIAERNFATVLTWNLWWTGLVFSVFFLGSAWCAVCPWDALAQWLVRRRLWRRAEPNNSLNLRIPAYLNNVWPALLMFAGLTWLELGLGVISSPYATALLSLLMVVLATVSLALFKRKAFCRHFCPVGRTVGFYSQLSVLELRPLNPDVCAACKTLDCYYGNSQTEPCPTSLVMGKLKQNSYCTSCGNCSQSCPPQNISWRFRSPAVEALQSARPHWDEAWFMLGLLALTAFHGITMMPFWEEWMLEFARIIGDSGKLLWTFSAALLLCMAVITGFYVLPVFITRRISGTALDFRRSFSALAFVSLPLAFSYHMAHNLNHLVRESGGFSSIIMNPLGNGALPLSMAEKHQRHMDMWLNADTLHSVQAALMVLGFLLAVQIIRYRGKILLKQQGKPAAWRLSPMLAFAAGITGFHLWMLMQPMIMRM